VCTLILALNINPDWPILIGANRDEKLDRPWLPPARHWRGQPFVIGGRDSVAGGTWLAINRAGMMAAVLNRLGSLGPAPGKRSRGDLPLLALRHDTAADAVRHLAGLNAGDWRSFNLVVADASGAIYLRGLGQGRISVQPFSRGVHIVTARDPDDMNSPRIARNLPRFRRAPTPNPPDWTTWPSLLADNTPPNDAAINITPFSGFGTVNSSLIALGPQQKPVFLSTRGAPDSSPYEPVPWPEGWD
jgi:hypothetical protein